MPTVAVLIPCYNEALTIGKVVADCMAALKSYHATVYVYDNNSTDGTAKLAASAGAVVRQERMQGKGNVIRRMFREIDADCYVMIDGDDTYDVEKLPEMVDAVLNEDADMVIGDRLSSTYFSENKRPFHNVGNDVVRKLINTLFRSDIKDILTGLRAFSYQFVKTFPILSGGFEIETEMTIHALDKRMAVRNIVVTYRDRPVGSVSKLNTVRDGVKVIDTVIRLFKDYKPMLFFSLLAAVLMLLAVGFFIPLVLLPYLQTGLVERFPTLIVCSFVALAALISFFTGLILDVIGGQNKREFEFRLVQLANTRHAAEK